MQRYVIYDFIKNPDQFIKIYYITLVNTLDFLSIQPQDADDSDDDDEEKDDDEGDDSDEDGDESDDDEEAGEEDDTINMSSSMLAADSETSAMSEDASFQSSFSKKSFSTPKQGNAILTI